MAVSNSSAAASSTVPSLSIIVPVHNAAPWLPPTLDHLRVAIRRAEWPDVEIVVVDDGSTDDTAEVLANDNGLPALTIVRQANAGRFLARLAGLESASGELVLFCDSRVFVHEESLRFIRAQIDEHPDRRVWNGHAITADAAGSVAKFWDAISFLAWRRYLRSPSTTSYGADEYDYFPKGTTMFLAPRAAVLEACHAFATSFDDLSKANDDTLMIRPLADSGRINISPDFSCTYHPRTSLRQFTTHSFHRGTVFVDGYVRPGTRYFKPYIVLVLLLPGAVVAAIRKPKASAFVVAGGASVLGISAAAAGVPRRNALALGALSPLFAVCYGAGTLRGLFLRVRSSLRATAPS